MFVKSAKEKVSVCQKYKRCRAAKMWKFLLFITLVVLAQVQGLQLKVLKDRNHDQEQSYERILPRVEDPHEDIGNTQNKKLKFYDLKQNSLQ